MQNWCDGRRWTARNLNSDTPSFLQTGICLRSQQGRHILLKKKTETAKQQTHGRSTRQNTYQRYADTQETDTDSCNAEHHRRFVAHHYLCCHIGRLHQQPWHIGAHGHHLRLDADGGGEKRYKNQCQSLGS